MSEEPGYLVVRTGPPRTDPWEAGDTVEVIPLGEAEQEQEQEPHVEIPGQGDLFEEVPC